MKLSITINSPLNTLIAGFFLIVVGWLSGFLTSSFTAWAIFGLITIPELVMGFGVITIMFSILQFAGIVKI